ncbi:ras guanine nucleotide exchange factor domain-containing protein [Pilobolus umbonatus]|nr:ras guanine nucleotide exchange factor domain-containing protein [Pilobolus umbonatus]
MILVDQTSPILSYSSSISPPTSPITATPSSLTSHFVQALHDYLPSSSPTEETVSCLYFKKGSIIEVFNRDDSGWWDGQSGDMRGWFPSNYVGKIGDARRISADFDDDYSTEQLELWRQRVNSTYNSSHMGSNESLLDSNNKLPSYNGSFNNEPPQSQSMELVVPHLLIREIHERMNELIESCFKQLAPTIQSNVFLVVSVVRSILLETNIANKDSPLLKIYPELARQRKAIVTVLGKLVLKGKELQQQLQLATEALTEPKEDTHTEVDQISEYADQLLYEIDIFQRTLKSIPRQSSSAITESTTNTRTSSIFYNDTPRSSLTSFDRSSMISSSSYLRQIITDSHMPRHNNSTPSLITKELHTYDIDEIMQSILDHRTMIDDLTGTLLITLEKYLISRQRVSEMLEITRKTVESVRSFLSMVEHVCSNLDELVYTRSLSIIPEDPRLISLVIAKESVYRTITNLVTAIRALTNPQDLDEDGKKSELSDLEKETDTDDFKYLSMCCKNVVRTTNECASCVRTCLKAEDIDNLMRQDVPENALSEYYGDTDPDINRGSQILSILGRKVTSLSAIQQYHEDMRREGVSAQNSVQKVIEAIDQEEVITDETEIGSYTNPQSTIPPSVLSSPDKELNNIMPSHHNTAIKDSAGESKDHNKKSSIDWNKIKIGADKISRIRISASDSTMKYTLSTFVSSTEVINKIKSRPRASSTSHLDSLSTRKLPPLPLHNMEQRPSLTSTETTSDDSSSIRSINPDSTTNSLKIRDSRRLSVSGLQRTLSRSKSSTETLPDTPIRRLPSWLSIGSTDKPKPKQLPEENQVVKDESENAFLMSYSMKPDEMIFNFEGHVTGATEEALVKRLTWHEKSPDLLFTRTFFYNFHLFTSPERFLALLIERFSLQPLPDAPVNDSEYALWNSRILIPTRLRVYNVLKTWLESFFIFEQDSCIEGVLHDFLNTEMYQAMPGPAKRMLELVKKTFDSKGIHSTGRKHNYNEARFVSQKSSTNNQSTISAGSLISNLTVFDDHADALADKYPTPIITRSVRNALKKALNNNNVAVIHVQDIDPVELARQITLLENNLFCQIRPNELIGQKFKKKIGASTAIHVKSMIQRSTQITSWVSDSILRESDAKRRSQVLKYWIKVGDACLQMNNYNTLMAIRSALDSTSIIRLKRTWEYLSSKYKTMWEPIHRATDSQRNFAEYRQRLKTTIAPCLPFLGVYLTDITFIDDGNSDHRLSPAGQKLINFDKYMKTTRVLNEIDQFQVPYKLLGVEEIYNYIIQTLETVEQDDQVFYNRSLQREPKEDELDRILSNVAS